MRPQPLAAVRERMQGSRSVYEWSMGVALLGGAARVGPVSGGSGDGVVEVAVVVVALSFALEVVGPVGVEVAAGDEGPDLEDGFGAVDGPPGAGDVHAVFDQVAAGAFDDAGGDRPAGGEGFGVVQPGGFGFEVSGGFFCGGAFGGRGCRGG